MSGLFSYDQDQAVLPARDELDELDFIVMNDPSLTEVIAAANELDPPKLSRRQIVDILAFLRALTDPASIDLRNDVPRSVPSGLSLVE